MLQIIGLQIVDVHIDDIGEIDGQGKQPEIPECLQRGDQFLIDDVLHLERPVGGKRNVAFVVVDDADVFVEIRDVDLRQIQSSDGESGEEKPLIFLKMGPRTRGIRIPVIGVSAVGRVEISKGHVVESFALGYGLFDRADLNRTGV